MLKAIKEVGVDYFYVDQLNPCYRVWQSLKGSLQDHFPSLAEQYRPILFNTRIRDEYSITLISTLSRLVRKQGLGSRMRLCF